MPVEIFFCYAHEDEVLRLGLEKQLRALKRQGIINTWHDREILPGKELDTEIDKHLKTADIILLLVSPDFMDSDYCYGVEMQRAMQRHNRGEARVIPVILRPVYWRQAPFGELLALPMDGKPVTSAFWHNQDEAFYDAAEGIRKAAVEIMTEKPNSTLTYQSVDEQVSLWIEATGSNSNRTRERYTFEIDKYRSVLRRSGLDLDCDDETIVIPKIKQWASINIVAGTEASHSTYNGRLSIASSFYKFAYKNRWIKRNPIEWIERLEDITINEARALTPEEVQTALKSVNRSTLQGKRNFALLHILFRTGRYVNEIEAMRCGDIDVGETTVTITFPRCKGGETDIQTLPKDSASAQALLNYLNEVYGTKRDLTSPVWISFSQYHANKGLHAIGRTTIAEICQQYIGTSKVFTTRKTWLKMQEGTEIIGIEKMLDIV